MFINTTRKIEGTTSKWWSFSKYCPVIKIYLRTFLEREELCSVPSALGFTTQKLVPDSLNILLGHVLPCKIWSCLACEKYDLLQIPSSQSLKTLVHILGMKKTLKRMPQQQNLSLWTGLGSSCVLMCRSFWKQNETDADFFN